ncbi:MAG: glycosyltransferase [Candidatus Aureabacteria bacterium]|nr:glycosyltransferase [Candidatus Auribacterota bacterium]
MAEEVSVIIAAKGRPEYIGRCLESVFGQKGLKFAVILVDDGLSAGIRDFIREKYPEARIISSEHRGPSYGRNVAAEKCASEFIAFTDSDCVADENWLYELYRVFIERPEAASCGGAQRVPADASDLGKKIFRVYKKAGFIADYVKRDVFRKEVEVLHNPSCSVMYRRKVFLELGGFKEGMWPGEDIDLDIRIRKKGYKIFFNPGSVVMHYPPHKFSAFISKLYNYGLVQPSLMKTHRVFRKIYFVPPAFLAIIVIYVALLYFSGLSAFLSFNVLIVVFLLSFAGFDPVMAVLAVAGFLSWNGGFFRGMLKRSK